MKQLLLVLLAPVIMMTRFGGFAAQAIPTSVPSREQAAAEMLPALSEFHALNKPFMERGDLSGLEQRARQLQSDWVNRDASSYGTLMFNAAATFDKFPMPSVTSKALAIEFRELAVHRGAETELLDGLRNLAHAGQNWEQVGTILPSELGAMRERYADRMLTAWQRAEDAWDQIKDRPVIRPVGTNNIHVPLLLDPAGKPIPVNELPLPESLYRFLREQGLGTGPEVAREYNFRIGLQNELPNYTNAAPQNLASAFSQPPQDLRRLAALTEQHLKKPESRDAFYGVAIRGIPENLRPQFLAVVRETQERRKSHAQSPSAPMVREHPNKRGAGTIPQGSNSVSAKPVAKPDPAVPTSIVGTIAPEPNAGEPARRTASGYLPLAAILAAGLVLWWFLSRSHPG